MRLCGLLALISVSIVIVDSSPALSRHKRGFLAGVHDRMGHGFGKRTDPILSSYVDDVDKDDLMTVEDLVRHIMQSEVLADAIVRKFIDINDDGSVSYQELLRKLMR
ncbi:uncharacterized protein LOC143058273 [Mytilus galloprovincialis]